MQKKRILLACYGGGHVQSLIPVVKKLIGRGDFELIIIGFTTARAAFERAGIKAHGYDYLLDPSDKEWLEFAQDYLPKNSHPDVNEAETLAYYAIGLKDLTLSSSKGNALHKFKELERKAFLPVETFTRFLKKIRPDLVITSTSPRSELALQYAASALDIETLAISDLFLQHESSYICSEGYAQNISVMAGYVGRLLEDRGYKGTIYATGNPAFDSLKAIDPSSRNTIREELGLTESERLILWVCPSSPVSMIGKPFVETSKMLGLLDGLCSRNNGYRYLARQHPSKPVVEQALSEYGVLCPSSFSIEDCLSIADLLLLETSTVGLQGALLGLPIITIGAENYPPYAQLGLSADVPSIAEAEQALLTARKPRLDLLGYPFEDTAADQVVKVINKLLN